jgi:hypothetical protein
VVGDEIGASGDIGDDIRPEENLDTERRWLSLVMLSYLALQEGVPISGRY